MEREGQPLLGAAELDLSIPMRHTVQARLRARCVRLHGPGEP